MLASLIFLVLLCMLLFSILLMRPQGPNPAVLHVSIPAGEDRTAVSVPDPWLNECWLLNITDASKGFTVKIEDVSGHISSYGTHLVIALNDAAYNNLVSLTIDVVTLVKDNFRYGTLRPYSLWEWPSGDVYPTWFVDTLVDVGTIPPKGHVNVTVSVIFSNGTGARMHFDAYGSKKSSPIPPTEKGYITHNPLSEDSTVLFWPAPLVPPVACFTVSNDSPNTGETVSFNASCSYDSDGDIVKYEWDWDGDCTYDFDAGNNPIATHYYDTYGTHYPKLRVTDNNGLTDEANTTILVRAHPVAHFIWTPERAQVGETVTFNASTSTPDGGVIVSWDWDFGDNTTGAGEIVAHHYDNHGNYTVTLNVTDNEGKWDTESMIITVTAPSHADFIWSPTSPQVGDTVTFDASASTPNGGTIVSYGWNFGDTSPHEFGKTVTHTYTTYGTYNVTLNVTDNEGKWDIEMKTITVRAHPNADFAWSPLQPKENQTVTFDASASTPNGGTIVSYNWNFGNGKFGTGKIVTQAYAIAGIYTVTLNVTDSEGKWDIKIKQITVTLPPPPPKPVGGCAVPIGKSDLPASSKDLTLGIHLAFILLAVTAAIAILIRSRKKP
jgi:PKD repeat protein